MLIVIVVIVRLWTVLVRFVLVVVFVIIVSMFG